MNLRDMRNNLLYEIPQQEYILIEYNLFFDDNLGEYNRFSVDDMDALKSLTKVLDRILKEDQEAVLYVLAYSYEIIDYKGNNFIYGDSFWLQTKKDIDFINNMFKWQNSLPPTIVEELKETDEYIQEHFYLFKKNGHTVDIKKKNRKENFQNVFIMYWD